MRSATDMIVMKMQEEIASFGVQCTLTASGQNRSQINFWMEVGRQDKRQTLFSEYVLDITTKEPIDAFREKLFHDDVFPSNLQGVFSHRLVEKSDGVRLVMRFGLTRQWMSHDFCHSAFQVNLCRVFSYRATQARKRQVEAAPLPVLKQRRHTVNSGANKDITGVRFLQRVAGNRQQRRHTEPTIVIPRVVGRF